MSSSRTAVPDGTRAPMLRGVWRLGVARALTQMLSVAWFIVAARVLDAVQLGTLGGALAIVVVLGGLSDVGTTRSVVRLTADAPTHAWAVYRRCASARVLAGVGALVLGVAVLRFAGSTIGSTTVAMAGAIAIASGAAEVGFGSLRSLGAATIEVRIVVAERVAFVVVSCALVVHFGAGVSSILAIYALTNLASAVTAAVAVRRIAGPSRAAVRVFDREGQLMAVATTLLIVVSKAATVALTIATVPPAVAVFVVASRIPEAASALAATVLAPLLPALRVAYVDGRDAAATHRALRSTTRVLLAGVAPVVLALMVAPETVLRPLFGADAVDGAATPARLLALWMAMSIVRAREELVVVASGRTRRYANALAAGLATLVLVTLGAAPHIGASAASAGAVCGEVVILTGLFAGRRRDPIPGTFGSALARHDADVRAH